jgi:hypothetical protein
LQPFWKDARARSEWYSVSLVLCLHWMWHVCDELLHRCLKRPRAGAHALIALMHYNNTWTLKKKKSKKSNTWNQKTFFVRLIVTVALIQLAYVLLVFQSSTAFFLTPAPSMNELRKTIITYIHGHVGKKICIHKKNVCIKLLHVTVSMCSSQCTDHSVWDEMLCIWRPRSHHGSDVLVAARTWIYWMHQCPSEGAFLSSGTRIFIWG